MYASTYCGILYEALLLLLLISHECIRNVLILFLPSLQSPLSVTKIPRMPKIVESISIHEICSTQIMIHVV